MPERIIRAVNHCRTALLAGYTTYRDLGSESMHEADVNVRDAIARGLIPGPRLFVATRVLASTGSFESRTENGMGGHCLPAGSEAVDGVEEIRKSVRRRIAAGADVIKFFADYRRRIMRSPPAQQHPYITSVLHPPKEPNPDYVVFS
jgi:imidazolonepropionase-like amidohydrolase